MFRKLGIGFAALTMLTPGIAAALGVGDYTLKSYLNQPFEMEVELIDARDLAAEEVLVSLAPEREFDNAGIERVYFLTDLEFEVSLNEDGSGVVRITSTQPVREPYLSFLVEFLWPTGRLMREYTVLLDPPSYAEDIGKPAVEAPATRAVVESSAPTVEPAPVAPAQQTIVAQSAPRESAPITVTERQEYVVQSDDTMWRIALNNRPVSSISVQQMLIAIQALNDDAFIDGNVNLVREGTVLRMPTEEEIRRISTRDALDEIATQNREWRARLEARGIRLPTRPQVDATARAGERAQDSGVAPEAGEVTLVAPTDGQADGEASATGTSGRGDNRALQNELAIRDERVDQLRRQNEELSSRLNDLSQQVETSEQLLKLRNEQIAKLQDQLRKLQEEQGLAPTEPVVVEPVEPAKAVEPAQPVDAAQPAESVAVTEGTEATGQAPAGEASTDTTAPGTEAAAAQDGEGTAATDAAQAPAKPKPEKVKPAQKPKPVPPKPPEPSFLDQYLPLLAGGAVLVLLVVGGLAVLARRRRAAAESQVEDADLEAYSDDEEDFFAADLGDDDAGDFASLDDDGAPAASDSGQDPLEEVDVYTAYGRHAEAVTFLKNEIRKTPERSDLKVRLLEVLAEMRDTATFEREATAFAGDTKVAARAADLRKQLGIGGAAAVATTAAADDDEPSLDDLEFDLASDFDSKPSAAPQDDATMVLDASDDLDFSADLNDAATTDEDEGLSFDMGGDDTLSLDGDDEEFTLDLDEDEAQPDAAHQKELDDALSVAPALSLEGSDAAQEEDIDFGEIELADASDEFTEAAEAPASEDLDLSLEDLDLDADEPTIAAPAVSADDELELSLDDEDDLSLSLEDDDQTDAGLSLETTANQTVQRSALDDLDLSLEDDMPPATDVRPAVAAPAADLSLGDDDEFEFLGDADENATKLDLAKAYIDMGDAEGARDILSEVIAEGSSAQQAEARELLAQVG